MQPHSMSICKNISQLFLDVKIPAILDPNKAANLIGDIIPNRICDVIGDNPATSQPEYKARHIQKIRRWHMNRHQLKRLKKKMK